MHPSLLNVILKEKGGGGKSQSVTGSTVLKTLLHFTPQNHYITSLIQTAQYETKLLKDSIKFACKKTAWEPMGMPAMKDQQLCSSSTPTSTRS